VDAPANRAFVTHPGSDSVGVLDATTGALLRTVAVGRRPGALAVDTRAGRVFVANQNDGTVSVLDVATGKVLAQPRDHGGACAVAAAERAGRALVLNGVDRYHGSLRILAAAPGAVLHVATAGPAAACPAQTIAVDPASDRALVLGIGDENYGVPSTASMVDVGTGRIVRTTMLSASLASFAAITVAGAPRGYILIVGGTELGVVDPRSGQIVQTLGIHPGAHTMAVDRRTGTAFIATSQDGTVSIVAPRVMSPPG
jgi:YVTN family beta-propeller protein